MTLSDEECQWFRNEREIIILAIKDIKTTIIIVGWCLIIWVFMVSIDVRVRTKQIVREEIHAAITEARIAPEATPK